MQEGTGFSSATEKKKFHSRKLFITQSMQCVKIKTTKFNGASCKDLTVFIHWLMSPAASRVLGGKGALK